MEKGDTDIFFDVIERMGITLQMLCKDVYKNYLILILIIT
jgi:hypothetical protein